MLEILLTCSIIALIAVSGIAAYYYAMAKTLRQSVSYFKGELPVWQSKALIKHGQAPLNNEKRPKPPLTSSVGTKIVQRGELEARAFGEFETNGKTSPINIYATEVGVPESVRASVIEEAQKIIK